jgi:uncharacterized protein (DUF111 family)
MISEDFQNIVEKLFNAGALDVYLTPIIMKKSRPATKITVLTDSKNKDLCVSLLFENTTSFGLRISTVEKIKLHREIREIETSMGPVSVKIEKREKGSGKWKLEYEDLKILAEKHNTGIPALRNELLYEVKNKL